MKSEYWVFAGIAVAAASIGYMVGGSSTPVVAAVLPLIFGILATGFGFFRPKTLTENDLSLVKLAETNKEAKALLESSLHSKKNQMGFFGAALLIFSIMYLLGTIVGTMARTQNWFSLKTNSEKFLPWGEGSSPLNFSEAVIWIELSENLVEEGYTRDQVKSLYTTITQNMEDAAAAQKTKVKEAFFPWNKENAPNRLDVALAWIDVRERLIKNGYTKSQILELYSVVEMKQEHNSGFAKKDRVSEATLQTMGGGNNLLDLLTSSKSQDFETRKVFCMPDSKYFPCEKNSNKPVDSNDPFRSRNIENNINRILQDLPLIPIQTNEYSSQIINEQILQEQIQKEIDPLINLYDNSVTGDR